MLLLATDKQQTVDQYFRRSFRALQWILSDFMHLSKVNRNTDSLTHTSANQRKFLPINNLQRLNLKCKKATYYVNKNKKYSTSPKL